MSQRVQTKASVYWQHPHTGPDRRAAGALPQKTDVLVIGSGITGIVAALQLRRAGVDVVVVESGAIGSGASVRNAGMILTGLSSSLRNVLKTHGKARLRRLFGESLTAIDCVAQLVDEGRIDCDFRRCGHLQAAFRPTHFDGLKAEQAFLENYLDHKTLLISPRQMSAELGSGFYHGGLVDPKSAGIHPAKYMAGLIRMADAAGAGLHGGTPACRIEKSGGRFRVSTPRGGVLADRIVVATNGYTGRITPWLQRRVMPVESFMIATETLPSAVARSLLPRARMAFDTKHGLFYFRLSPDGRRLLFGGRPKEYWKPLPQKAMALRQDMLQVFPQLAPYAVEYAWGGNVGVTVSQLPLVGERNGVAFALGYCGHGVALSTYFGFKLADMLTGNGLETAFAEKKPGPIPFYRGTPWLLPIVHGGLRLLDRLR